MKKLLILAYDFPPYVSVGGLRPYSWYKYLKEYGVEPIVVTRQWENKYGDARDYISPSATNEAIIENTDYGTIIRAPFKPSLSNRIYLKYGAGKFRLLRKTLTALDEIRQFITISGPKKELYKAAHNYLKENEVDAIIATGEPFVLFYYAKKLNRKFNIPWIADYRDPWSQSKNRAIHPVLKKWIQRQEIKNVSTASLITTANDFFKLKIQQLFPEKEIKIVYNGFDPSIKDEIQPQSTNQLTISFIGTVYKYHPWKSFLLNLDQVNNELPDAIRVHFYGVNIQDEIIDFIARLSTKTQENISFFQRLPNEELIRVISKDNVMLLFNYYSNIGTKIFDYLALQRKILFCYTNDTETNNLKEQFFDVAAEDMDYPSAQVKVIKETDSGILVKDQLHLIKVLKDLNAEFQLNGEISCKSQKIDKFSRQLQAKELSEIINFVKS